MNIEELREAVLSSSAEVIRRKDGKIFYFTENNFKSLHSHVQDQKKLNEIEAKQLYAQIVRIVAFCHSMGIIVRDLKLRKFVFANSEL